MNAYRKEWRSTLVFGALYLALAHTGLIAILTGVDNSVRVLGFPLHYFLAIFLGSAGVMAVSILWNRYADNLEDEIEMENGKAPRMDDADMPDAAVLAREGAR